MKLIYRKYGKSIFLLKYLIDLLKEIKCNYNVMYAVLFQTLVLLKAI